MNKDTSISLGDHFDTFIQEEINSGRYNSVREVIRAALRLFETEEQKRKALLKALKEGEKSETLSNFNAETHLKGLHDKHI